MSRQIIKTMLHRIITIVCLCIFIYSFFMLTKKLYGYYHDNKQYQEIRTQVISNDPSEIFGEASTPSSITEPIQEIQEIQETVLPYTLHNGDPEELNADGILSIYSDLKKQNGELVGWVQVPGFKNPIDYPVMQAVDNEFYLQNDFYKNFSYAGSIYMDYRNRSLQVDRHIILYGHAMNNRAMFGNFKEFPKRQEDHTKITKVYLDLMNTRLEYEIFSVYFENASYNYRQTSFTSDDEYLTFLERIRSKSVYDYEVKLTSLDRIITLSTCNNNLGEEMRSVTHARLVRQIIYDKTSAAPYEAVSSEDTAKDIVSANTYLSQLLMNYESNEKTVTAIFTPAFSTAINSPYKTFSTQLPPQVETVSLSYKTADPEATVKVTLNEKETDPLSLKLEYGNNVIKVKVVSRDKLYARIYTINATRLSQP